VTTTVNLPNPDLTTPYELLISPENFRLAWERVRYHDRSDSRDLIGLKIFAANRDYNLEVLRNSLIQRTFEPAFPEIKYLPKQSLTLRPMAILPIKDRVVYQVLANVVAEKSRSTLSLLSNRQSFANVLCPRNHEEMFISWKSQHQQFQQTFANLIEEGNSWLVETDIAAFYETIDHARLFDLLRKLNFVDDPIVEYLEAYMPIWASVKDGQSAPKGLPQGSLASDLLANVFLYELDETLAARDCHYLRYVDDIRLLAKTKEAVQRGLIQVDRILKSMGLLIQTKKTTVRKVTDPNVEFDRMGALLSEIDRRLHEPVDSADVAQDENTPSNPLYQANQIALDKGGDTSLNSLLQDSMVNWFWQLKERLDTNDNDRFDEKHLRFLIWRLEPNTSIAKTLIPLLVMQPWLSELITSYIKKCELDKEAIESLHNIIENHTVYDSVVALVIDTLLVKNVSLRQHHVLFRKWLAENSRDWPLLSSVALALGESSDNMAILVKAIRQQSLSPSARRMAIIQASRLARTKSEASSILKIGVTDQHAGIVETALYLTYIDWSMSLSELNRPHIPISEYSSVVAKGYDNSLPDVYACYIRHVFAKDYNVSFIDHLDFRSLMGDEYNRAASFAWQAERSYLTNPSRFVSQLDLFHEEMLFFILVDKLKWKSKDELVKVALPDRISHLIKNKTELATFGAALQSCHQLRSSCTEAHTRLHKVLDVTNPINWRQRNELKKKLCAGYQELVVWIENGGS
jgi:retron-type reverse transcriptase